MTRNHIGVDLSKDWLDVFDPERGASRMANSKAAISRFLRGLKPADFLIFEATSGCDRVLREGCDKVGTAFARINPLHGWHYSQSLNLAKTDRLDARMLARFGAERQPDPAAPDDPARVELGQLNQRRDQLKRMETQEKNRLRGCGHAMIRRAIKAMLKTLALQVRGVETAIAAHLRAHLALGNAARLLRSVPGIGPVTAAALLAHLPELGQIDRRAVASLGGLAPKARESGKFKGTRVLGPGRRQIRRALYMSAMHAFRHKSPFCGFVEKMRAAGKASKLILIALARKLLTVANAIIRTGKPFQVTPQITP